MAALVRLENSREPEGIQRVLALRRTGCAPQKTIACGVPSSSGSIGCYSQRGFRGYQFQQSMI